MTKFRQPRVDVLVADHGTVVRFTPRTAAARRWFDANVASEGWQWLGGSLVVDHRPAIGLLSGLIAAGLRLGN